APFWVDADSKAPSLQITSIVCAAAARVAEFDEAVAEHPWFASAVRYCLGAIAGADSLHALELAFALQFLDAVHSSNPEVSSLVNALGKRI
ncbi:hypothetical protein, partial [Escherichia coli]